MDDVLIGGSSAAVILVLGKLWSMWIEHRKEDRADKTQDREQNRADKDHEDDRALGMYKELIERNKVELAEVRQNILALQQEHMTCREETAKQKVQLAVLEKSDAECRQRSETQAEKISGLTMEISELRVKVNSYRDRETQ